MEKVGLWIIFLALGVLIVWLTFAFWDGPSTTAVLLVSRRFWPMLWSGRLTQPQAVHVRCSGP
jgi:hypothetical protein